jgi:hypothetical protein
MLTKQTIKDAAQKATVRAVGEVIAGAVKDAVAPKVNAVLGARFRKKFPHESWEHFVTVRDELSRRGYIPSERAILAGLRANPDPAKRLSQTNLRHVCDNLVANGAVRRRKAEKQ